MAVQIETQGQLSEFLEILSRRRWQLLLPAALLITLGVALAVFIPKKYLASTQVEVRPVGVSVSGKEAQNAPNQIRAYERVRHVLQETKNAEFLSLAANKQNQFVSDVRDDLKVRLDTPSGGSSTFVTIEYANVDPTVAASFLRALREDWRTDVLDRDKYKVDDEVQKLGTEVAALEKDLRSEEDELSSLCQKYGITATQPIPGGSDQRAEDPDFTRLQDNKTRLQGIEFELAGQDVAVASLEQQLRDTPEKLTEQQVIEGVNNSNEMLELEKQIREQQAELERFRPENSKYQKLSKKLAELQQQKDQLKKAATRNELASVSKVNPERATLQKALDAARLKQQQLTGERDLLQKKIGADSQQVDELYVVYKRIREHRQKADRLADSLKSASVKYSDKLLQAKQLASPLSNPFSVTQDVIKPEKPTEPNPWLIVAFALVAGLTLGLTVALTAEYSRNCFRSVHDISRVMVAPVLGSVGRILTRRQRRMIALRRVLVATASISVIAGIAFVTWAWARDPELLSPQLRARIEQIRDKMR